ncbi:sigma-70 family RNA polymerase sigma factor [Robertmurraya yapensis]|uniref:Sigma-70 family RNA polymerase sigma factor n=1 Tax=Bacillus yapensis TaxID=2492960 RepID=A0A3S0KMC8_9BACI|nr:sigma-70 family RNA polymerase sigma factor [Bacillus yapensis]RTR34004.1 sigma-70 family RNA polymerase sigma factor [Bacillus yapensis]TKS97322.1 sigma-70 family RNA polymerase sigma factor [Bacillus yapensis]
MNKEEREQLLNDAMEQHGDYLKHLIYTYVKDIQKTQDIIQDVFIKFYKNLDHFENRSSIKTYLYRIAVNECKNYLRSWHYRKMEVTEKIFMWKNQISIESEYIQREEKQNIAQLVGKLSVRYREVIWLYYYLELSVTEIADVLNCSVNTVKTRLTRGRKLMRLTIEESEGEYEY